MAITIHIREIQKEYLANFFQSKLNISILSLSNIVVLSSSKPVLFHSSNAEKSIYACDLATFIN
ncbi:hypothetical protein [Rickettsia hoogstraalii]|uniref:hypothetical protein n=1 Tax=Rickettsia hoogstraalii TaxID=467174 RepID=UPI000AE381AB|nr:hypothetical protein [Rickettsia hoogstraalii]